MWEVGWYTSVSNRAKERSDFDTRRTVSGSSSDEQGEFFRRFSSKRPVSRYDPPAPYPIAINLLKDTVGGSRQRDAPESEKINLYAIVRCATGPSDYGYRFFYLDAFYFFSPFRLLSLLDLGFFFTRICFPF